MESTEGTVLEKRIDEVLGWAPEKHRTYNINKKTKKVSQHENYTQEMYDYAAKVNEEVFHIFGYAKNDDDPTSKTQFMDYKGKAHPENVKKTNFYKEINKKNWEKRMKVPHGQLPKTKVTPTPHVEGTIDMIEAMNVVGNYECVPHLNFEGVL